MGSDPSSPPLYSFKPEYSNNFEVGSKNDFLDNRLRVNVTAFYTRVTDARYQHWYCLMPSPLPKMRVN
ncbi:TonB-dependent receptor domain-containing protein [Mucilaginibacter metallidurans]|uniref:TonB-dependent receptor domain-containing protein n=1 Tax=Mucilaginibacter sp. P4 TaxID=3383180 RepID=UPI00142EA119